MYSTFPTRWKIVQHAKRFSDNCNYYGFVEQKPKSSRTEALGDLY